MHHLKTSRFSLKVGTVSVDMAAVTRTAIVLVVFIAGSFIAAAISGLILNTTIQKYSKDLRRDILKKVNVLPLNYFDTKQIGDILSVVTNDVDTLSTSLQNSISMLIQAVVTLFGVIIAMFIANWQMAIAVVCSLPLMLLVLFITFKFATPYFNKTQKVLGEVNSIVEENFSGQIVVKAFNAEKRKINEFIEDNERLGSFLYKSQVLGGIIEPFMSLISYLTYAAILIIGGLLVHNGTITLGVVGLTLTIVWEIVRFKHPERFYEISNDSLTSMSYHLVIELSLGSIPSLTSLPPRASIVLHEPSLLL